MPLLLSLVSESDAECTGKRWDFPSIFYRDLLIANLVLQSAVFVLLLRTRDI